MSIRQNKRIIGGIVVCIFSLYFLGCKEKISSISPPQGEEVGEKVIWSNSPGRPEWIYKTPRKEGEYYLFAGESEKFAIEKGAREAAYRDAIKKAGIFITTSAENSFQKILANSNVESQIIDRTINSIEYEKQVSNTVVKNAKVREYYEEQRKIIESGQIYWIAFAHVEVPLSSIDEVYKDAANQMKELMLKESKTAKDKNAKEQLKSAIEGFDEIYKKGFSE